jgi:hypothetical protein
VAVSIDQLPEDMVSVLDGRWLFQLTERLNGHLGGALLEEGRTLEPVSNAVLKRFICGQGHVMAGALRVVGPPAEIGDCASLRPVTEAPQLEPAPEPEHAHEHEAHAEPDHDAHAGHGAHEPTVTTVRKGKRW